MPLATTTRARPELRHQSAPVLPLRDHDRILGSGAHTQVNQSGVEPHGLTAVEPLTASADRSADKSCEGG